MANGQSRQHAPRQSSDETGGHRLCGRLRIGKLVWKGLPSSHGDFAGEIPLEGANRVLAQVAVFQEKTGRHYRSGFRTGPYCVSSVVWGLLRFSRLAA